MNMNMNMNMKWTLLFGLWIFGFQAHAEQPVVIDAQTIGAQPAAGSAGVSVAAPSDSKAEANEANKQQFLKGGKMSPRERAAVAKAEIAESNKQTGADFLEAYKSKPGVISLPSGVQYKILRAGKGKQPTEESQVRCRYKGTLIDGSTIDKTDSKKPSTMRVAGFLAGLKEAVKLMPTGSKWEIVIPPQLAYGALGNRGVGPNAVLIYEMEILGVK
jgi:FKBP-type peptidyl-prolyl cis-trans isomerase